MLLVMSPAPTSRAQERATSPITRNLLTRPMEKLLEPLDSSFRTALTSDLATWTAGAAPAASAVSLHLYDATGRRRASRRLSAGSLGGAITGSLDLALLLDACGGDPAGAYWIELRTPDHRTACQVLVIDR